MDSKNSISIWFFIGSLLLIYGLIILSSNIYDFFIPFQANQIVLGNLHFGIWWGVLLTIIGTVYFIAFRPWKNK